MEAHKERNPLSISLVVKLPAEEHKGSEGLEMLK